MLAPSEDPSDHSQYALSQGQRDLGREGGPFTYLYVTTLWSRRGSIRLTSCVWDSTSTMQRLSEWVNQPIEKLGSPTSLWAKVDVNYDYICLPFVSAC